MAEFELNDVVLEIPDGALTGKLRKSITDGRYEGVETRAITLHLRPGERVLELGAGAGYLTVQIARRVGARNVVCVDANPEMAKALRGNLERNGAGGVTLVSGAVVPQDELRGQVAFAPGRAFWASSLAKGEVTRPDRHVDVRALRVGDLLAEHRPEVLVVDIEGGEARLFDAELPDVLRLVVIELHPKHYGPPGIRHIFDRLSASGFAYVPMGSRAKVVVFERVT